VATDRVQDDDKTNNDSAEEPVIIKKYANRRLYNTATGEFVTLETLHRMVNDEVIFTVLDAKTGKDLTASILAQIIAEETKGHNMLPLNMLRQLLKFYGDGVGPQFSAYLEQSIESFTHNQQKIMKQMTDMLSGSSGVDHWVEMSRRNLELFQNSFNVVGNTTGPQAQPRQPEADPKAEPVAGSPDMDALRKQLAEMQKQLNELTKKQ
ncbi:uncharacterized protein METZ01_LOCUS314941, partial [marine metagenome]